jgi:serine phosphatase RsbU (regulator of sigma subunit)
MQVLVVNPPQRALPEGTTELVRDSGWEYTTVTDYRLAIESARTGTVDAVIMAHPDRCSLGDQSDDQSHSEFNSLVRLIDAKRIAAVVLSDGAAVGRGDSHSLVDVVDSGISLPELRGRLAMIDRYHGLLRRLEHELHNMERLSKRLNRHFQEVDQEMGLAARLQRDFLPDLRKPIGNIRFATVFRPASWVSGDMFDVFRIDEDHTGVYLADAVGHGMAASLLTMFIKRAIVPKRVEGDGYTIVDPSEVLATLNDALVDQSLPDNQFVTACYALINHRTLTFQYARGGHPYPIMLAKDGVISDLKSSGGLLGLSAGERFPTFETRLYPGDKILLFTDGVELAFQGDDGNAGEATLDPRAYQRVFESLAKCSVDEMMRRIDDTLEDSKGSVDARDDLTLVGLEVLESLHP